MKHSINSKHAQNASESIYQLLSAVSFVLLITLFFSAASKAQTSVDLFLPISAKNQTKFAQTLRAELQSYKLTNVTLHFADHWHDYQQGLRTGRPGIYFAAPHFSAWAINRHNFKPLLRIAEPISYVISAKRSQAELFEIRDLINHRVCSRQPLELDYLLLADAFNSKIGSVYYRFIDDVNDEMTAEESSCDGFVISNHELQRMTRVGNHDYIRLHQSQNYNNYAFVAHPEIDSEISNTIIAFLARSNTRQILQPLLQRYANETTLINASRSDYPESYADSLQGYWSD